MPAPHSFPEDVKYITVLETSVKSTSITAHFGQVTGGSLKLSCASILSRRPEDLKTSQGKIDDRSLDLTISLDYREDGSVERYYLLPVLQQRMPDRNRHDLYEIPTITGLILELNKTIGGQFTRAGYFSTTCEAAAQKLQEEIQRELSQELMDEIEQVEDVDGKRQFIVSII